MSAARIFLFVIFMLAMLGGINAQVFRWARNAWQMSPNTRTTLKVVLVLAVAGMVLGRVAGRLWPGPITTLVIVVASVVELAIVVSGILLLGIDAAGWALSLALRLRKRVAHSKSAELDASVTAHAPPPAVEPGAEAAGLTLPRRAFLTQAAAGSAFLIGGSSALYGSIKGRYDYRLEELAFKLPGLSRAFDGFTIAQLSDVHIGVFVGDGELAIAEELLRRAKPDLIVLTGDLLDSDPRLADRLGRFVRRLTPLAREGVIAIPGNHDYFAGVEDVARAVTAAGARMLRNAGLVLGQAGAGIALLGVDDVYARREGGGPDLDRALATLPRLGGRVAPAADLPRLLLCHNPSFFAEARGRVALQLSGHTHGGQVNLGLRPADYLLPGGWVSGRYDEQGSSLYVNRGFGTVGPPARIGAPPEVTRIVLSA